MDAIAGHPVTWRNGGDVRDQGTMSIQSILNHDDITIALNPSVKKMRAHRGKLVKPYMCSVLTSGTRGNAHS
jgi:hypothetical protein